MLGDAADAIAAVTALVQAELTAAVPPPPLLAALPPPSKKLARALAGALEALQALADQSRERLGAVCQASGQVTFVAFVFLCLHVH